MVKPIEWMPGALPSMDCPAAPFMDDFEENFKTRLEQLPETYSPISDSGLQIHGELLNVALLD